VDRSSVFLRPNARNSLLHRLVQKTMVLCRNLHDFLNNMYNVSRYYAINGKRRQRTAARRQVRRLSTARWLFRHSRSRKYRQKSYADTRETQPQTRGVQKDRQIAEYGRRASCRRKLDRQESYRLSQPLDSKTAPNFTQGGFLASKIASSSTSSGSQ